MPAEFAYIIKTIIIELLVLSVRFNNNFSFLSSESLNGFPLRRRTR